jgi:AraC-like DNA-binding protein
MLLRTCIPRRPLSDFIQLLWSWETPGLPHERERVLPDGSIELVIDLVHAGGSVIVGAHSRFFVIDTAGPISVVGVHFKPGGARPFLGLPAGELQNQLIPLGDVLGRFAGELRERLLEAAPGERFEVLENCLLERAHGRLVRHGAVSFAVDQLQRAHPKPLVADVVDRIGLSHRCFNEHFVAEVGLTPKLFARLMRFQDLIRGIGSGRGGQWADIALSCGYSDQAHFAHDFRAFSGLNASAYLAQRTERIFHVPLPA